MRGKAPLPSADSSPSGITPAYAGKSVDGAGQSEGGGDHPRVCGEKPFLFYGGSSDSGSPPRVRGKEHRGQQAERGRGITPAYAGKSTRLLIQQLSLRDHPRVCGEKRILSSVQGMGFGSPPRMRGKESRSPTMAQPSGITPAYAGKRKWNCHITKVRGDHPRVCGEKSTTSEDAGSLPGSPPRMRGKV
mgnify:CR=1 FL=1